MERERGYGVILGQRPLLKGDLAYLGRHGLERLCSEDQFLLHEHGGGRVTLICSSLKEGEWRHKRDLKRGRRGRAFQLDKVDCSDGQEGKGPEDEWTGQSPWLREGKKGERR